MLTDEKLHSIGKEFCKGVTGARSNESIGDHIINKRKKENRHIRETYSIWKQNNDIQRDTIPLYQPLPEGRPSVRTP